MWSRPVARSFKSAQSSAQSSRPVGSIGPMGKFEVSQTKPHPRASQIARPDVPVPIKTHFSRHFSEG